MKNEVDEELAEYYRQGDSWSLDRERQQRSTLRIAWSISAVAAIIALTEAFALVALVPLKTVVPYTLLVDRQTGYVQALKPLERETVAPDKALARSFLAQYVIAREGFQIESLKDDYRKVALWSAGEARKRYIDETQASNPTSPLATLPRRAIVAVEIRSMSSLSPNTSLIRFVTFRTDAGGQRQEAGSHSQACQLTADAQESVALVLGWDTLCTQSGLDDNRTSSAAPSLNCCSALAATLQPF